MRFLRDANQLAPNLDNGILIVFSDSLVPKFSKVANIDLSLMVVLMLIVMICSGICLMPPSFFAIIEVIF